MLKDVAGVGDVERSIGERQAQAGGAHGVTRDATARGQLARVGVHTGIPGTGAGERVREVARTATDVEH